MSPCEPHEVHRSRPAIGGAPPPRGHAPLGVAAVAMLAPACAVTAFSVPAWAQATSLPAVTVQAPAPKKPAALTRPRGEEAGAGPPRGGGEAAPRAGADAPARTSRRPPRRARPPRRPPPRQQVTRNTQRAGRRGSSARTRRRSAPSTATCPRVSETATKTRTPLIRTPQSISVIGSEQTRGPAGAQTVVRGDALHLRRAWGSTFGDDTRNDFLLIRGFPAQVTGYFLDGLQLVSPGFATFKLEPFNLERIEVLKGPASVLYGGSSLSGIINGVSKRPTDTPHGLLESRRSTITATPTAASTSAARSPPPATTTCSTGWRAWRAAATRRPPSRPTTAWPSRRA